MDGTAAGTGSGETGGAAGAAGANLGGSDTGGAGGGGAGGGGAGGVAPCLDPAEHAGVLALDEPGLCLVGKYTAPFEVGYALSPTWGRHGGPLVVGAGGTAGTADVTRFAVPATATGVLAGATTSVPLGIVASGSVYLGATAIDLPFGAFTLLSWTGDFGTSEGEVLLVTGAAVAARFAVSGFFDGVGIGAPAGGRLLYTGLTPLAEGASAPPLPAAYSADFCAGLDLCASGPVASWGEANGPIALDADGNVFVVETSFSTGDLALRGFAASTVAPGAPATDGVELFTLPGFGSELAAMGGAGAAPGLVFFQPFDPTSFEALDVVGLRYITSDALVGAVGPAHTAITLATPGTAVSLMADATGRLWLGAVTAPGETTFFVLGRDPGA
ncbi:MAG: hypothetical protein HY908_20590 [Myxococcales bacterium]|nr:hypothetical protein [Myxococcales bacterium]